MSSEFQLYDTIIYMLDLVLKKHWFEKIKSGEKKIEFRKFSDYWKKRILKDGAELIENPEGYCVKNSPTQCILRYGYSKVVLYADIEKVEVWNTKENDLNENPCFAIFLKNVREKL